VFNPVTGRCILIKNAAKLKVWKSLRAKANIKKSPKKCPVEGVSW
jgi:hypothetical protein